MPKPKKGESLEDFMERFMKDEKMMMEYPDEKMRSEMAKKEHKKMMMYEMETVDLLNVPVFSSGKWEGKGSNPGGDNITESVLDSWVTTFKKVGAKVKPRLRITHDEKTSKGILNSASLGWITDLKHSGGKLYADIKSVPKKIASLIEQKAFGRFSPGVYPMMNINGENHLNVLDHIALLGADLPANMDLDGFIDLYDYNTENENDIIHYENKIGDIKMENIKTYEAEYKQAYSKLTEYEIKYNEMKKEFDDLKKTNEKLKTENQKKEYEKLETEVKSFLDVALKDGKIFPAQMATYMAIALTPSVLEYNYIESDKQKKINGTGFDLVKSIITNNQKMFEFGVTSDAHQIDKTKTEYTKDDGIEVEAIKEYAKKEGISYREAYVKLGKEKKHE